MIDKAGSRLHVMALWVKISTSDTGSTVDEVGLPLIGLRVALWMK